LPTVDRFSTYGTVLRPDEPEAQRRWAVARVILVSLGGIGLLILGSVSPSWYPPCPLHQLTGLYCTGCGSGRAIQALAHGELVHAFTFNVWMMTALPLLLGRFIVSTWRGLRHDLPPLPLPHGTAMVVLVISILFTVARNLPWWPFRLLAPG